MTRWGLPSVKMEPNTTVVFDSLPYIEALSRGDMNISPFTARKASQNAKEIELYERISYLKEQVRTKDRLLAEYEKAIPLKRSVEVEGKKHVGYVITRRGTRKKITV